MENECPVCGRELNKKDSGLLCVGVYELLVKLCDRDEQNRFYLEMMNCSHLYAKMGYCYYCDKRRINFLQNSLNATDEENLEKSP